MRPDRTLCAWCADWPVVAVRRGRPDLVGMPIATVRRVGSRTLVVAASAEARAEGVVPGLRRREAEARCPGLAVVETDPGREARMFEELARATESITPRIALVRPGVLTFPTRGPSRYFGGDDALVARALDALRAIGVPDARVGVAEGPFAARLAARVATPGSCHVVERGRTPGFLAPWPVGALGDDDAELAGRLHRLGITTLGAFAALPAPAVLARFGASGVRAHRRASGFDELVAPPAPPPPDLVETGEIDPPATRVDEAGFVAKGLADRLLARLDALGLSCTQVAVEAETELGERLVRSWRHEGSLTAAALAARVRWGLEGWLAGGGGGGGGGGEGSFATAGITLVRLTPEQVVAADGRQLGFWGGDAGALERADRVLARLQGLLGHDAVVTAVPRGGRTPTERVRWVRWGDERRSAPDDTSTGPGRDAGAVEAWRGAVLGPIPARVYAPGVPAELLDRSGQPVGVSSRGEATGPPAHLWCPVLPGGGGAVRSWAGPWAHDVRWWDGRGRRRRALWHVVIGVADDEVACLVGIEGGRAVLEAVYD